MKRIFAFALFAGVSALAVGQPPSTPPKAVAPPVLATRSDAEKKLAEALGGVAKAIADAKGFTLKQESDWSYEADGTTAKGKNHFEAHVRTDGKFRIRAWSDKHPEREFLVVSDGKTVTRILAERKIHSVDETAKPFHELADDALTAQALEGSFLTAILRPDIAVAFDDLIDTVQFAAEPSRQTFTGMLESKKNYSLAIELAGKPTIAASETVHTLPLGNGKTAVMKIATKNQWAYGAPAEDALFVAKIPEGSVKVEDLMEALTDGGSAGLLGKPVPELKLVTLDGKAVDLAADKGKPVMLYFYASWAAPSVDEMAGVNKFVESFSKKGAAMYAINVAEGVDVIKKLNEKNNYTGTIIRDPKGEALGKLKLNVLPVSVLLGKDGTVQGIYKGTKQEVKVQLRKDLEALLEGKTLHK